MQDTRGRSRRRYHDLLRAQEPHERLAQVVRLTRSVRELAIAGIGQRYPDASVDEMRVRLVVRLYGHEAALRIFASVPPDAV